MYKVVKNDAQPVLDEEVEDEEVSDGESVCEADEVDEEYDDMF